MSGIEFNSSPTSGGGASEETLQNVLTELQSKLDEGGTVALDGATLSALETISATILNQPTDFPDSEAQTTLESIDSHIQETLTVSGTSNQGTPNSNTNGWPVKITDGTDLLGSPTHPIRTDPTGTTSQPVTAANLPLPAGAATSANQTSELTKLDILHADNVVIEGYVDGIEGALGSDTGTPPSSGIGIRGWLRGIYDRLADASQITKVSNGSTTVDSISSNSGQNSLLVSGARAETNYSISSISITTPVDVSNYRGGVIQVQLGTSITLFIEGSNDNSNWSMLPIRKMSGSLSSGFGLGSVTSSGLYEISLGCRYIRLNTTAISGTASAVLELFSAVHSPSVLNSVSAQSGVWTVQPGNTPNTTPWLVQQNGFSYSHISTNTTTTVKSGSGVLHSIVINTLGTTDTLTIYDNTAGSGTVIAVVNAALSQGTFIYDCAFSTGLTVVSSGTTPPDVTINYR